MKSPKVPGRLDPGQDRMLVERCLDGDPGAWEALVRRHERLVYSVACSYGLSDEDLGDVFQDVFAALIRGLPRMRDGRALVRWLSSTTERIARATALRRRRELALSSPSAEEDFERIPSGEEPVGADLELLEEQALVRLALEALPERCRELLRALYYEVPPPSYEELSRRFHMPHGSLGPTRARCFDRLRETFEAMRDEGGINPDPSDTSRQDADRTRRTRSWPGAPSGTDPRTVEDPT